MDRWASLVFLIGLSGPGGPLARAAQGQLEETAPSDGATIEAVQGVRFAVSFAGDLPRARRLDRDDAPEVEWEGRFTVGAGGLEIDLLGAAAVGPHLFWLVRQARQHHLLAARCAAQGGTLVLSPAGPAYSQLVRDLRADERLRAAGLAALELRLEGLAAWHGDQLLLGLRDPIPDGRALLVPLRNPDELAPGGGPARFAAPLKLDLGGLGVRSVERWDARELFLLVAGQEEEDLYAIYRWSGDPEEKPRLLRGFDLAPERRRG